MKTADSSADPAASDCQERMARLGALLRRRAGRSRKVAWVVLGLVIGVLGFGGWMFWYLPKLDLANYSGSYYEVTPNDYSSYSGYSDYDPGTSTTSQQTKMIEKLSAFERELLARLKAMEKRVVNIEASDKTQNSSITVLESETTGLKDEVSKVDEAVKSIKHLPETERQHWEGLFTAFATRFGIAALLLLLLKLLTSIYRYHVRLAAFYDAKADALDLAHGHTLAEIELLSAILTPTAIDFNESADSIMDHAIDLAKRALPVK